MPTEDRGSHEKRQDKKRKKIQHTKYQNWNSRQNTEQTATILWTSESDEDRTIPQNSIQRLLHGTRKRGKQKKKWIDMIIEDCSELHLTLQEAKGRTQDAGQESVASIHRRAADACNGIAWAIIIINNKTRRSRFVHFTLQMLTKPLS